MLLRHPPRSLPPGDQGDVIEQVLASALEAVRPDRAIERAVARVEDGLVIAGVRYPLDGLRRVRVMGVGKAAAAMVRPLWELLGDRLDAGLVIGKRGESAERYGEGVVEFIDGAHPLPDADSVAAAERTLEFVAPLGKDDLLILAISGGTSSLLTLPSPGLELGAVSATTQLLLRAGAAIDELNSVRKHLSQVKGGRLAQLAAPAPLVSLILSDVVGNSPSTIGSGPTAPDTSTFADARRILSDYAVDTLVPGEILDHLDAGVRGDRPETLDPDDPCLEGVRNVVIGSNESAVLAAVQAARELGFRTELRDGDMTGEARVVGTRVARDVMRALDTSASWDQPTCWVYGGETTVTVLGAGRGGRNQELALAAGVELSGVQGVFLVAFATDGIDGPTDAAGAIATGSTLDAGRSLGLDAEKLLDDNDSYAFFDGLGDLLRTGPSGTNVADLVLVFMWPGGAKR